MVDETRDIAGDGPAIPPVIPETQQLTFAENILSQYIESGVIGCTIYLADKAFVWLHPNLLQHPLNFGSYLAIQVAARTLLNTVQLTQFIALKCLGNREQPDYSAQKMLWKTIGKVENLVEQIDLTYSDSFAVRTQKEVRALQLKEDDLNNIEFLRNETIKTLKRLPLFICTLLAMQTGAFYGIHTALAGNVVLIKNTVGILFAPLSELQLREIKKGYREQMKQQSAPVQ
ncbi:MAG: hypothetical protein LW832_09185 [Parachlamydia sp.]|jgi:hypothetical protein|nr:hypothetical protein [Parachlamydia sp.]